MHRIPQRILVFSGVLPLLFAACASPAAGAGDGLRSVADGGAFSLAVGERVKLADDSTLHYVKLVNDSRCPPNVQCVWAGDAIIALEWTPASGAAQQVELHTGKEPRSQAIGTRTLRLVTLERGPAPAAQLKLEGAAAGG